MKYVTSFQPAFNITTQKGSIIVYFSDGTAEPYKHLEPATFTALLGVLEQKNITFSNNCYYCNYPHNAVEILRKQNIKPDWEE